MSYTGKLLVSFQNGYPCNVYSDNFNESGVTPPPPMDAFLLLEDGFFLLLETGGKIILEP